jgi:hypothetical protein
MAICEFRACLNLAQRRRGAEGRNKGGRGKGMQIQEIPGLATLSTLEKILLQRISGTALPVMSNISP